HDFRNADRVQERSVGEPTTFALVPSQGRRRRPRHGAAHCAERLRANGDELLLPVDLTMPALSTVGGGSLFVYGPSFADFTLDTTHFGAQISLGDSGSIVVPTFVVIGTSMSCDAMLAGGQTLRFGFVDWAGHAPQKLWFQGTLTFNAESPIHV